MCLPASTLLMLIAPSFWKKMLMVMNRSGGRNINDTQLPGSTSLGPVFKMDS